MPLLDFIDLHKSYGTQILLDGASATIGDHMKIGLIGANGSGKSTLLKIILGDEEPDGGEVVRQDGLKIGFLRQHDPFEEGETVQGFLERDSGQESWRCAEVAGRFALKGEALDRPVRMLSGGWQTRVKLAALLLHDPDLLLLDEPTNFLDVRTQILLERFLKDWDKALIVVSHDRRFLCDTTDHTLELAHGRLSLYPGTVEAWLKAKDERREHAERVNAALDAKRKQLERFIEVNRASAGTASQARNKAKQLEKLNESVMDIAVDAPRPVIRLPAVQARRGWVLRTEDMSIGYGERTVAKDINLDLEHGGRYAVVGDNGEGKSTLLKTVSSAIPTLAGNVRWSANCRLGLYAQHVYATLDGKRTVYSYLENAAPPHTPRQDLLDLAGAFLFRGLAVEKPISVLSGGERARLVLAGLLVGRFDVLLLDEPGNHLDVESLASLTQALKGFQGTIIFTSHDRAFVEEVATAVLEVRAGAVAVYPGDYPTYLYRIGNEIAEGFRPATSKVPVNKPSTQSIKAKPETKPELGGRRAWELKKQVAAAERKHQELEKRKEALEAQMLASANDHQRLLKLNQDHAILVKDLALAEENWFKLQAELDA